MSEIITKVLPGFMELLPEEQIEFDRIKSIIAETYEQFGFTALDTPVIERSRTLLAKAGGETEKQIYSVENKKGVAGASEDAGGSDLSMRFDLTVPLARYVADHFNDLSFPFRRCHIAKVYRGERPQKGRFREFYQCDIDVIGKDNLSIRYDAEIPSIIYQIFQKLNFGKFTIRLNNRKLLNGLIDSLDATVDSAEILRIIDKVEKISAEDFEALLAEQGLTPVVIETLQKFLAIKGTALEVLEQLGTLEIEGELFRTGVAELETVTRLMLDMGVAAAYFTIDLSIARGLDYYTGTVYETKLDDYPKLGSVCSGGRFDNLASYYTEEKLPGVGISIGLTRLFYQLRAIGLIPCAQKTIADVIVVPMDDTNIATALKTAGLLRDTGLKVDVLLEELTTRKKFQYVSRKDAKCTIVIGSQEEETGQLTLQYKQGDELRKEKIPADALAAHIHSVLSN
jgi:histidyl-tRNA synthetase